LFAAQYRLYVASCVHIFTAGTALNFKDKDKFDFARIAHQEFGFGNDVIQILWPRLTDSHFFNANLRYGPGDPARPEAV